MYLHCADNLLTPACVLYYILPLILQSEEEATEPSEDELELEQDVVSNTHHIIVHI